MTVSGDMVKRAWEEVRYPQQWVPLPHKRAWVNKEGWEISDLTLMQMQQQGLITHREMTERLS